MKFIAVIFCSSLLTWSVNTAAQVDKIYYSLDEALAANPDSVYRLDLSKNKLSAVPESIYQFKNLRELNLSQNKFKSLPDNFYFPNLEILNLEKNDLDTFSTCLCNLTTLRNIYLGKNDIRYLPECIGNLQELITIDIWFNPLQDLPMALTTMRKLRYMDVRGVTYSNTFQKKWNELLPWVKIEFDLGCDCAE